MLASGTKPRSKWMKSVSPTHRANLLTLLTGHASRAKESKAASVPPTPRLRRGRRPDTLTLVVATTGLILSILAGALASSAAAADEGVVPSMVVANDQWTQLVVPGNPAGYEVGELFGPALAAENYTQSWIVFTFDAATQSYVDPGSGGSLKQGQAFWLNQRTGDAVTLTLPPDLPRASAAEEGSCGTQGCVKIALGTRSGGPGWNMVGAPTRQTLSTQAISIHSDSAENACAGGCTISEASDKGVVDSKYWRYDGDSERYVDVVESGQVNPWEGVWVGTYPDTAKFELILRITGIETQTDLGAPRSLEIEVSPFVHDPNILTLRDPNTEFAASVVGTKNSNGLMEELTYLRVDGAELNGEVRTVTDNGFSFRADNGAELVVAINDEGELLGVSFKLNASADPIVVGQLPIANSSSISAAENLSATSRASLDSSAAFLPLRVAVTKCGEVSQPDPRAIEADIRLSGAVNTPSFASEESWTKSGNVYTTYLPNYDERWETTVVDDTAQWLLYEFLEGSAPHCATLNRLGLSDFDFVSDKYEEESSDFCAKVVDRLAPAIGILEEIVLAKELISKTCKSPLRALKAVCTTLNNREPPYNAIDIQSAVFDAMENEELNIEISVRSMLVETGEVTGSDAKSFGRPFAAVPMEFSLHGGPVDTVMTIETSPNPSKPGELVSVDIAVEEKDGEGCAINKGTVTLREFPSIPSSDPTLFADQIFAGPFSIYRNYTAEEGGVGTVSFQGRYEIDTNDNDYRPSEQATHAHEVSDGNVVRIDSTFVHIDVDTTHLSIYADLRDRDLESIPLMVGDASYGKEYEYVISLGWGTWIGEGTVSEPSSNGSCKTTMRLFYRKNSVSTVSTPTSEQEKVEVSTGIGTPESQCNRYTAYGPDDGGTYASAVPGELVRDRAARLVRMTGAGASR